MEITPPPHKAQACDDEIDLFERWGILWAKRLLILVLAALCGVGGLLFATFHPGKPDQYIYTVFVEIGRYITQTGEIQALESPHDLVLILNQQIGGAKASVPRGSMSVVSLEANHVDPAIAKQQLDRTLAFISDRHETLASRLQEKLLTRSGSVAEPTVMVNSIKNKRMQVVVISAIVGLLLGVFWAMVANAVQQRGAGKTVD